MNNFQNMIYRILKQKGTTEYTLRKVSASDFVDPDYPSKGSVETVTDYSLLSFPDESMSIQGEASLIKQGDIILYIDTVDLTVTIDQDDRIIDSDGDVWRIIRIQKYCIKGDVIFYAVQIRK